MMSQTTGHLDLALVAFRPDVHCECARKMLCRLGFLLWFRLSYGTLDNKRAQQKKNRHVFAVNKWICIHMHSLSYPVHLITKSTQFCKMNLEEAQ